MIRIKRIYEPPDKADGHRILVDRLWPRGMKKENAVIDRWMKEIAPSDGLRKEFGHEPERWDAFRKRYFAELDEQQAVVSELMAIAKRTTVTLLFSAANTEINNAVALKEYLEKRAS